MSYLPKPDRDEADFINARGEWDIWTALSVDKDLKRRQRAKDKGLSDVYQKDAYMGSVRIQGL